MQDTWRRLHLCFDFEGKLAAPVRVPCAYTFERDVHDLSTLALSAAPIGDRDIVIVFTLDRGLLTTFFRLDHVSVVLGGHEHGAIFQRNRLVSLDMRKRGSKLNKLDQVQLSPDTDLLLQQLSAMSSSSSENTPTTENVQPHKPLKNTTTTPKEPLGIRNVYREELGPLVGTLDFVCFASPKGMDTSIQYAILTCQEVELVRALQQQSTLCT